MSRILGGLAVVRLATRNVTRSRSRSALTLGAVFFGVALSLLLASFGNGLVTLMTDDVVNAKAGALQVYRRGYADVRDSQSLDLDLPTDAAFEARLRAVPGVAAVAPRLVFAGLVSDGNQATMFLGRGIDPMKEYAVLPWATRDVDGLPVRAGAPTAGVVGGELARGLGVGAGGTLILQATTQAGRQNALDLDVGGTLAEASIFEVKRLVVMPLALAQSLVGMPGRATSYVVRTAPGADIDAVAAALRESLGPDHEVQTWRQILPNLADIVGFQRAVIGIISGVFLVIVVFGVANTMMMSVLERTREIGTMMAVGMRRAAIASLLVVEAIVLAATGAVLGTGLAYAVVNIAGRAGGFAIAVPGTTVARHHLVPLVPRDMVGLVLAAAIAGAVLAALYPAWKASRLRPVDALRAV